GVGTPGGSVSFVIDGATLASGVGLDNSGKATFQISTLTVGNHTVVVNYSGSTNFNASSGTLTGGQIVAPASTTTTVTSSASPSSVFGQAVTFTAVVAVVAPGTGTPTGNVNFIVDGSSRGILALSGGRATLTLTNLVVGNHTVVVNYLG